MNGDPSVLSGAFARLVLVAILGYGTGAVVGAFYIVRARTGRDVRALGSGNAGARNVLRSVDVTSALLTFAWDAAKGALAIWISRRWLAGTWTPGVAFVAVIAGHVWPVQLGFRGGKGVAPAIGCTVAILASRNALAWPTLTMGAVAWGIVAFAHHPLFARHRAAIGGIATTTGPEDP